MNDTTLDSPEAIKSFLAGTSNLELDVPKEQRYGWITETLIRTKYLDLRKKEKSTVRQYIMRCTGYSRSQLTRLISQYKQHRKLRKSKASKNTFTRQYTNKDILLLVKTDQVHQQLSGAATKKLLERAYHVFKQKEYLRLSSISVAHIYNLRKSTFYQRQRNQFTKTQYTPSKLGERRKPSPNGKPGFIRVDTVHQGDRDKRKGVYHINAVDEVTQFEVIVSVEKISERFLIPVLKQLLESFPFEILNFHSDNGSEYVNHMVVKLLNKLHIEFTKSRPRHSNDNALAESKNGSIVRKYMGYTHIPQKWAPAINKFYQKYLVPYINYHRPCYFAEIKINDKGKEVKKYPYKNIMTPYDKLKSLDKAEQYLKSGITFKELDKIATNESDQQSADNFNNARDKLFKRIFDDVP